MAKRKTKTINFIPDKVKKPSGLKNDGTPNTAWRNFEERVRNFENIQISEWGPEHILGYILKRYKDHYGMEISLSYSGPPTKCSEIYCIKRMMSVVGTEKGQIAKQYIDWVFDEIIIPKKAKVTSLAFFFTQNICNQFKSEFKKLSTPTKTTELPPDYYNIITDLGVNAQTYGDLAFIRLALDSDPEREDFSVYNRLFQELEEKGFNKEILMSLEG